VPSSELKENKKMNARSATFTLIAALLLSLSSIAIAQDAENSSYMNPRPLFRVLPPHGAPTLATGKQLVQWNGSFTDRTHKKINFTMVGTDPSKTNVTTTITVWVIPIKFVFDASHGNRTFDPQHKLANGRTVIKNTLLSPLFSSGIDFKIGSVDLGNTQYEDAFQRGTWWGKNVKKNNKYHLLLKPVMKPEQTINCNDSSCMLGNPTGPTVGLADINFYDVQVQGFMRKLGATPDILPFFVFYDTYLTENGGQCCIGGYHSANAGPPGGQTYSNETYMDTVGVFSQDVSAMSHELGEWMDDPFGSNAVKCPADLDVLEVGDPLENGPNYGAYKYELNGFTYNLQSLVFVSYFGAPASDSANKWYAFRNDIGVCPGQ
jgi:hypothetical protein